MNRVLTAITFLTRVPVRTTSSSGAIGVGQAAAFFPLIGAGIGAVQWLLLWISLWLAGNASHALGRRIVLPASVLSVLITAAGLWITRALHLDGLADMADGFGGGRTREDVLRIMRDHVIGSFGAAALVIVLVLKFTSITVLIEQGHGLGYLVVAPALSRGSIVVLGFLLPYARATEGGLGSSLQYIGRPEVLMSSIIALASLFFVGWWRGAICVLVVLLVSFSNAYICMRRIDGITGDTLGANSEICEALILATASILGS